MNKTIVAAVLLCASASMPTDATQYSKLSVITIAKQRGCWASLKAFIADADLKDEWDCCQYLSDDYPQFPAATNALVSSGVCTDEDVLFILTNSVDSAVGDACVRRVYDNDMKSSSGRVKWHGKMVRQVVDTNTLTSVKIYEDGTAFTDRAKVRTPLDSARAATAKLPNPVMTNGVPARLAAARLRQRENETSVSNVTVNITAGM